MKPAIILAILALVCAAAGHAACLEYQSTLQLAMGPDPGGHSGATVTPETTKTDNKAVDSARETRSGGKTENVDTSKSSVQPPAKDQSTSDTTSSPGGKK
jgi:hypothetical protein